MKLIPKKQNGGFISPTFAEYHILLGPDSIFGLKSGSSGKGSSSSKEDSNRGKLTQKDLFSLLDKLEGLPNEMSLLSNLILNMYLQAEFFGTDVDASDLASMYSQINLGIKTANFNKKAYDTAFENVNKNGGLDEIAIGERGEISVYDKDRKLKTISINTYLNNRDKYQALTNSELLYLRAHDPKMVNDNTIFSVINNGIGMLEVSKLILQLLGSLGTDTSDVSGYVQKVGDKVASGIKVLEEVALNQNNAVTDGIYKVRTLNKTLKSQAEAALRYIYNALTPNALNLLKLKGGNAELPELGALNLISQKIMAASSDTSLYSEEYQDDFDVNGNPIDKKTRKAKGEPDIEENVPMAFMNGRGFKETVQIIPGSNVGGSTESNTLPLVGSDNKPFTGKYLDELSTSGMVGLLDLKNATMGGNKIVSPNQVEITENNIHSIYWPTLPDGITPDLRAATIENKRKADEELKSMGIDPNDINGHAAEIGEVYAKYELPDIRSIRRFAVMDAMTNNQALGMDSFDDTDSLQSVDDRTQELYEKTFKNYHSKKENKDSLDLDHNHWINPLDWFGNYDKVYKGLVWIPVHENYYSALAGTGEKVKSSDANAYDMMLMRSDYARLVNASYLNPSQYE